MKRRRRKGKTLDPGNAASGVTEQRVLGELVHGKHVGQQLQAVHWPACTAKEGHACMSSRFRKDKEPQQLLQSSTGSEDTAK
eukprot:1160114-Pelagomonas_calceolata.AAC.6